MQQNSHLEDVARQVESAAQMEVAVVLDVIPGDDGLVETARLVQASMRRRLRRAFDEVKNSAGMDPPARRKAVRDALIDEINRLSLGLINEALVGFRQFSSAAVEYLIGADHPALPSALNPVAFDSIPAISGHDKVLEAVLRIRAQPPRKQLGAALMLETRWLVEGIEILKEIEMHHSLPADESGKEKRAELQTNLSMLQLKLAPQLLEDANTFYGALKSKDIDHWAIPIEVSRNARPDDLRFVAELFRMFGGALVTPCELHFRGEGADVAAAEAGQSMYESAGVAFKVLSAWLMAVNVIEDRAKCSICYRHCSAISRCSIHATKLHETRDARLAKAIWPHYVSIFNTLSRNKSIKPMLKGRLTWSDVASAEMLQDAEYAALSSGSQRKAIVLDNQLRELAVLLNDDMLSELRILFADILRAIRSIEQLPRPITEMERYDRQRLNHSAKELLSLKGLFRAWWGVGRYSPEIDLNMRGVDRDHPVFAKDSPFASSDVARTLLEERAWRDAEQDFKRSKLPTATEINRDLDSGLSKAQIAVKLSIGLSTVYRILERCVFRRS